MIITKYISRNIPPDAKFSILIPTWNNQEYLKLCLKSINQNSRFKHQVLIHVNDGCDGTLQWLKQQEYTFNHSCENIGICWSLNALRCHVATDYIVFMNDDMYVCPDWDLELWHEIEKQENSFFFLSSTLLQPGKFWCDSVISGCNYGTNVANFQEEKLLREYKNYQHKSWNGATWPPNIVPTKLWDLVGGYSVELSPGMYSDPDFAIKLWKAGVRNFKGVSNSRVYHFEAKSTARVKKNKGSRQFLMKWGITSSTFTTFFLRRGTPYQGVLSTPTLKFNALRCKLKRIISVFKKTGQTNWHF